MKIEVDALSLFSKENREKAKKAAAEAGLPLEIWAIQTADLMLTHGSMTAEIPESDGYKEPAFNPSEAPDLGASIDTLGLKTRPYNCLNDHGMTTVADVLQCDASFLLKEVKGMGQVSFDNIVDCLMNKGYITGESELGEELDYFVEHYNAMLPEETSEVADEEPGETEEVSEVVTETGVDEEASEVAEGLVEVEVGLFEKLNELAEGEVSREDLQKAGSTFYKNTTYSLDETREFISEAKEKRGGKRNYRADILSLIDQLPVREEQVSQLTELAHELAKEDTGFTSLTYGEASTLIDEWEYEMSDMEEVFEEAEEGIFDDEFDI